MKRELKNLKNALRKKAVCVLLASIVFLSVSCTQHQKAVLVQQKTTPVPSVRIDTCFVYHRDTAFVFETDTFRIETIIRDTLITQHIETKPYYIKTTDTIYIETPTQVQKTDKKDQKEEIKRAKKETFGATMLLALVCFVFAVFLANRKK